MKTIYIPFYNADMTEGRGPMLAKEFGFEKYEEAKKYIDAQPGVMGCKAPVEGWPEPGSGDWQVRHFNLLSSANEVLVFEEQQEITKVLEKLTARERKLLGLANPSDLL